MGAANAVVGGVDVAAVNVIAVNFDAILLVLTEIFLNFLCCENLRYGFALLDRKALIVLRATVSLRCWNPCVEFYLT